MISPGDRITVTMPRSPSREGEYVEDRGTRCRVPTKRRVFGDLAKRIENLSYPEPNSGCWLWEGALSSKTGYGSVTVDRRTRAAHRVSCQVFVGPIPEGMFVCHRCDNRACVNPQHLFLGTPQDNTNDMHRKGRWREPSRANPATGDRNGSRTMPERLSRGERKPNAKLTEEAVRAIRQGAAEGRTRLDMAREHGVSRAAIRHVLTGKAWKHVTALINHIRESQA